jgi:phosphoribosylformylglycinamidine (FGAM) synthase PurS component
LSVSWLIGKSATARLGGRFVCKGHSERGRVSTATTVLHTVAIRLKIPDNTAFSALTALRRLGVQVDRVERADIWQFAGPGSSEDVATSVKRNESLFNPNKHVLEVLDSASPRAGETWISNISSAGDVPSSSKGAAKHYVAWRLFGAEDRPADKATVASAIEKLLCNPAIERAIT